MEKGGDDFINYYRVITYYFQYSKVLLLKTRNIDYFPFLFLKIDRDTFVIIIERRILLFI